MNNIWSFFDSALYINLNHRTDRRAQAEAEFQYVGLEPERIEGTFDHNRVKGFNKSQHDALWFSKGNTVIFEDDVKFHNLSHLPEALKQLPPDWDILYLGANIIGSDLTDWPVPEYYTRNLRRITQAWTTHAVCYSEKCVKWLLENWDYEGDQIYDDFLRENLKNMNAFIVYPMICDQHPGFSDIWNRPVNYGFFSPGNQRM